MRSELVFGAMTYISNRYLIVRLAAKASSKLHRHILESKTRRIACLDPAADTSRPPPCSF
jgi:hypothetical protein